MTQIDPGAALIGMMLETARDLALDSVTLLTPEAVAVTPEAFSSELRPIFDALRLALDQGRAPTRLTLELLDPELKKSSAAFAACFDASRSTAYGDFRTAREALQTRYALKLLTAQAAAVLKAAQQGQLDEASGLWAKLDLEGLYGPVEGEGDLHDYELPDEAEDRPFRLTHQNLNHAIGGGLGSGGSLGMSLWVLPSGSGKSSLWYGEVANLCEQGHWVIYCAGEASSEDVISEIVRLRAGLLSTAFTPAERQRVPQFQAKAQKALDEIKRLTVRGQLRILEEFSPATLKRKVLQVKGEMAKAGATGKLMVVVDNYDSMFSGMESGKEGHLSAVNAEVERLYLHARRHDYHIAWLAQTDTKAAKIPGPCGADDVYGNRNLRAKMSHVITGYRPITEAARNETDKDGNPTYGSKAWLAVRKLRGAGQYAEIEMRSDNPLGAWEEKNKLPF